MRSALTAAQKDHVIEETARYIALANDLYQTNFATIPVYFNLKGHTIGMYKVSAHKKIIRYNEMIFHKYFEENIKETVPHEVAHYIVDMQFGLKKVRPHGLEWRSIMRGFGANASRVARYDLSDIPKRRYSTIEYKCACQIHQLGIRRHNKVVQGKSHYTCRHCGSLLKAV